MLNHPYKITILEFHRGVYLEHCLLYINDILPHLNHSMSDVFADDTTELYPVPDLDKERPYAIPLMRPLPIHRLEVCLINFNKVFKILQYSEMECNYVRTITTGLLGKHSIGRSPPPPLNFETLGFSLSSL